MALLASPSALQGWNEFQHTHKSKGWTKKQMSMAYHFYRTTGRLVDPLQLLLHVPAASSASSSAGIKGWISAVGDKMSSLVVKPHGPGVDSQSPNAAVALTSAQVSSASSVVKEVAARPAVPEECRVNPLSQIGGAGMLLRHRRASCSDASQASYASTTMLSIDTNTTLNSVYSSSSSAATGSSARRPVRKSASNLNLNTLTTITFPNRYQAPGVSRDRAGGRGLASASARSGAPTRRLSAYASVGTGAGQLLHGHEAERVWHMQQVLRRRATGAEGGQATPQRRLTAAEAQPGMQPPHRLSEPGAGADAQVQPRGSAAETSTPPITNAAQVVGADSKADATSCAVDAAAGSAAPEHLREQQQKQSSQQQKDQKQQSKGSKMMKKFVSKMKKLLGLKKSNSNTLQKSMDCASLPGAQVGHVGMEC